MNPQDLKMLTLACTWCSKSFRTKKFRLTCSTCRDRVRKIQRGPLKDLPLTQRKP